MQVFIYGRWKEDEWRDKHLRAASEPWNYGGILKPRGSMDSLVHAAVRCLDDGIKNKYKIRKEAFKYGTE